MGITIKRFFALILIFCYFFSSNACLASQFIIKNAKRQHMSYYASTIFKRCGYDFIEIKGNFYGEKKNNPEKYQLLYFEDSGNGDVYATAIDNNIGYSPVLNNFGLILMNHGYKVNNMHSPSHKKEQTKKAKDFRELAKKQMEKERELKKQIANAPINIIPQNSIQPAPQPQPQIQNNYSFTQTQPQQQTLTPTIQQIPTTQTVPQFQTITQPTNTTVQMSNTSNPPIPAPSLTNNMGPYSFYGGGVNFKESATNTTTTVASVSPAYSVPVAPSEQTINSNINKYDFSENAQRTFNQNNNIPTMITNTTSPNLSSQTEILKGQIVRIPAQTSFEVYILAELDSSRIKKGEIVEAVIQSDFIYQNVLVAPAGSLVYGTVVGANAAGHAMKDGRMVVNFDTIVLPDGATMDISTEPIEFSVDNEGKAAHALGNAIGTIALITALGTLTALTFGASGTALTTTVIASAGTGAAVAGINAVNTKGSDVEIPNYTSFILTLTSPLDVVAGN